MARPRQVVSGPSGEFSLRIPGDTQRVMATVAAPGFPATIAAVEGQPTHTQLIVVRTPSALLHIVHRPDTPWPYLTLDRQSFLPVTALFALGPGGIKGLVSDGAEISVVPGGYTLCDGMNVNAPCQTAVLSAGDFLTVHANGGTSR